MTSGKSLWGDLSQIEAVRTPFVILQEQAVILGEITNGLILGEVSRLATGQKIQMDLSLVVPALDKYRYAVVEVQSPIVQTYPLTVKSAAIEHRQLCDSEEEFEEALRSVLSSPQIRKVIATLLSDIHAS